MSTASDAAAHDERSRRARAALLRARADAPIALHRAGSNLFRDRAEPAPQRLDLGEFRHVIAVDPVAGWVDVEGGTPYDALVDATLARGTMPAVVPQLRSITAGGAAAGVGIEATSFREGLVHHTMLAVEVLLASGEVVVATADNEHHALFHGFANSYGTLGWALRLRLRTRPVRPVVQVRHRRFGDAAAFVAAIEHACNLERGDASGGDEAPDFVDGVVFDAGTLVLNLGRFVDEGPALSDYGFEHIYWRSLLERETDHLAVRDWLWRWDTDWFWCSRNLGAERPWVRRLLGRSRLNSRTYTRWMRWNARLGLTRRWARLRGLHPESVIQDVDIPVARGAEFLEFLQREIGIAPVWVCPLRDPGTAGSFPLYPLEPRALYLNFGFWDVVQSRTAHAPGHYNRLVEREVRRLGGIKSLYSDSFFDRDEFAAAYGGEAYEALKARCDPGRRLPGLYEKCVLRL
jgi:FAD/FMN-containing dehydrogenase